MNGRLGMRAKAWKEKTMSTKGKRTNDLITEYADIIEKADGFILGEPERQRIAVIRAELQDLAGAGKPLWDHDGSPFVNGPGWELIVRWATGGTDGDRWYEELYQVRAALALLAHGEVSERGMSADLTPEGAQFGSRAWIERHRG